MTSETTENRRRLAPRGGAWSTYLAAIRRKYGLSEADYLALEAAYPVCGICGEQRVLYIDHDHTTGRVRGLICSPCNRNLGWYEKRRQAVAAYLTHPAEGGNE